MYHIYIEYYNNTHTVLEIDSSEYKEVLDTYMNTDFRVLQIKKMS